MSARHVTLVVHVDGDLASHQYRLPLWAFEAGRWGAVVLVLLVVLFFAFAEPLAHAAAKVPGLEHQVARLEADNARVQQLATALNHAEAHYQELRELLSVRSGNASAAAPSPEPVRAPPVRIRHAALPPPPPYEPGPSAPTHWPLTVQGFVTRGQVTSGAASEAHAGIDIAVPMGSEVRAAGGGQVETAGMDSAYGLFVLVRHPDGYETLYGHASQLLVHDGDSVKAGQVIARSGNTGHSTAPHLHFEIRHDGTSIDPLTLVAQEN